MSLEAAVRHQVEYGLDAEFWRGLAAGELLLPHCPACERWVWPAPPRCPSCSSPALEWRPADQVGTVYSWTRTHYPFVQARVDQLPYLVLVVELPHAGGVRLLGQYAGDQGDPVAIGESVRCEIAAPSPRTFGLSAVTWAKLSP